MHGGTKPTDSDTDRLYHDEAISRQIHIGSFARDAFQQEMCSRTVYRAPRSESCAKVSESARLEPSRGGLPEEAGFIRIGSKDVGVPFKAMGAD